jgi:hypothetical protein
MSASATCLQPNAEFQPKKLLQGRQSSSLLFMPSQKDKLLTLALLHQELFMGFPIMPGAFYRLFLGCFAAFNRRSD